jgi:hypothetical protein
MRQKITISFQAKIVQRMMGPRRRRRQRKRKNLEWHFALMN